jgi:hypothetical protein
MTTTLTARGPEDFLAVVPVVLGFRPEDSLVMLTFGARRTFHARLDLPPPDEVSAVDELVDALLGPSRRHRVRQVAFVVYSGDRELAARLAAALVPAFVAEGIAVLDVLRAHGGRWSSVPLRAGGRESEPAPYDDGAHPFAAQAVFEGRVTRSSREELRATIAADPELRERWAGLLRRGRLGPAWPDAVCRLVAGWVDARAAPDDEGAARVLAGLAHVEVRDAVLGAVGRAQARDHVQVWSMLLRGAPDSSVAEVAAVTAFCAWLSGDGALAWCALDRCFEADPEHGLGRCLPECLTRALPPTVWDEVHEDPTTWLDSA